MISRLIEARAEDMRAFVEEAAGISRYKDRRRETENRISHTRENLERLNDLREEVDKQIRHLQRQAGIARRYQESMERKRQLQAELLALQDPGPRQRHCGPACAREPARDRDAGRDRGIAIRRSGRRAGSSRGTWSARTRSPPCRAGTTRQVPTRRAPSRRSSTRASCDSASAQTSSASRRNTRSRACWSGATRSSSASWAAFLSQAEPELNAAQAKEAAARAALAAAEAAIADWQQRWEEFSRESADAMRDSQVEQARIEQIDAGIQRLKAQRERLAQERTQLEDSASGARPEEFAAAEQQARDRVREAQQELETTLASLQSLREAERDGASALDAAKAELQAAQGELMTVEAVQKSGAWKRPGRTVGVARKAQAGFEPATGAAARSRQGLGACGRNGARQLSRGGLRRRHRRDRRIDGWPERRAAHDCGIRTSGGFKARRRLALVPGRRAQPSQASCWRGLSRSSRWQMRWRGAIRYRQGSLSSPAMVSGSGATGYASRAAKRATPESSCASRT